MVEGFEDYEPYKPDYTQPLVETENDPLNAYKKTFKLEWGMAAISGLLLLTGIILMATFGPRSMIAWAPLVLFVVYTAVTVFLYRTRGMVDVEARPPNDELSWWHEPIWLPFRNSA